jgi:CO dehydrogenase/acetyl-CoA synthase beta subunit
MRCPTETDELLQGLPVSVGSNLSPNIILKEDTAVELGNPSVASCAFILWTSNLSLVRNGQMTLVGPDIKESLGESLPFAQILLIGGRELKDQHHLLLEQHYLISSRIEGYMVRLAPQRLRMWTRVSKDAVNKGFTFETLGRALIHIYKSELPMIEAAEVFFITSSKEDVMGIERIANDVQQTKNDILSSRFTQRDDGSYECTSGYVDCRDCPDNVVCDDIRDIIRLRRKKRNANPQ